VPGATVSQPTFPIDPQVVDFLQSWERAARVDLLQTATVESPAGPIQISANSNPNDGLEQIYRRTDYLPEEIDRALQNGAVLVSEPLANRLDLPDHGGVLSLSTPRGLHDFPVAGIYFDYASTQGNAIMSLDVYREYWQDDGVTAVAVILESDQDSNSAAEILRQELSSIQKLLVRTNKALRAETLAIFDRTFAITGALQLMTTFVAFVGVLSAMMSLQLDKKRQFGILRAVGLTGRQLWKLVALETGLMGSVAGILAMPTGYILALILVYIINRRSFGWTLQMQLDFWPFLQAFMVAILASLLAGIYPAWRIVQGNTAETIRFE
jgi:putative ABC transport system permease protein